MISPAFRKAERARIKRLRVTGLRASKPQLDTVERLAEELGIEVPEVDWGFQAADAIDRLKAIKTRPSLLGFSESTKQPVRAHG